ncbi:MAG: hypothetical protein IKT29_03225 [Flavobacteriales bacterium]|nr:hypothetical protein [Flavobacteriales bacterium]
MAQKGEYVFDPKKLLPTTIAQIDSTASRVWNAGLKDRSNMGLFMESIEYVGRLCMGSDSTLVEYCHTVDSLLASSTLPHIESTLSRNLAFLKDHTLYHQSNNTWSFSCKDIEIHAKDLSYVIKNAHLFHTSGENTLTITSFDGSYYPSLDSVPIKTGRLSLPISTTDSIIYHIGNSCLIPHLSHIYSLHAKIDIAAYSVSGVLGSFEYMTPYDSYPIFTSHSDEVLISDRQRRFSLSGQLHTRHRDISINSTDRVHAIFTATRNNTPLCRLYSNKIQVMDSTIRISRAISSINIGQDSLTHPLSLGVYDRAAHTLTLYQNEDKLSSAPFYNSFSELKLFARAVRIDCNDGDIAFAFDSRVRPLVISSRYFEKEIYRHFGLQGTYNPLPDILSSCQIGHTTPIEDISRAISSSYTTATHIAMELSRLGYGHYDYVSRSLTLYPGFEHMVLSANGKKDYDGISYYGKKDTDIIAHMDGKTGHIDLSNMEMVKLSPSGDIFLTPDSTGVIAQKEGNFSYGGSITLGLFTIDGRADFEYEKNSITLGGTSQMKIRVPSPNGTYDYIKNTIDSLRGEIILGAPDDKSMRHASKSYPILSTSQPSYIFYPHLDSLYGRDNLHLTLEPFMIDSLSARSTGGIHFDGTLYTGGIVPAFARRVSVMKDLTLGFEKADFNDGVSFYSRGEYYGTLDLDGEGITGDGHYTYLSATVSASPLRMYPHSVLAYNSMVKIDRSDEYNTPRAFTDSVKTIWDTAEDIISIYADSSLCHVYDDNYVFTGLLLLSPKGLTGNGTIKMNNSVIESPHLSMGKDSISSYDAHITLGKDSTRNVIIENSSVSFIVDEHTGIFTVKDSNAININSINAHISMSRGTWNDSDMIVNFYSPDDKGYVSINSKCTLSIPASSAEYNPHGDSLHITGTDSLIYAHSYIIPSNNDITILSGGEIRALEGAEIILDTSTRYHHLYDAHIEILPGCGIKGRATYDYTDADGITYPMLFSHLSVDETGHIVAAADTYMEREYELGAYFRFRGQSTLKGSIKGLGLRGTLYPIDGICSSMITGSIKIDSPVGDTLRFNPTSPTTNGIICSHEGFVGVFMGNDIPSHSLLSSVHGIISHDDYMGIYEVGDTSSYPLYRYYHDECRITTRGDIFINDAAGYMKSNAAGTLRMDMNDGSITGDSISIALTVELPSQISESLISLASQMALPSRMEKESPAWKYLSQKEDISRSTLALEGISLARSSSMPTTLIHSGSVTLRAICGTATHLQLNALLSITKSPNGTDEINLYFYNDKDRQYIFLRYKNGTLDFMCSDNDTMKAFDTATEKYRDATAGQYIIRRASKSRVEAFKATFK